MQPSLVIVSGPPASGKTTLARPLAQLLGMPLLAKDAIKERIADAIGPTAMDISGSIGLAAHVTLADTAREILEAGQPVMLESFFHRGKAEPDLAPVISIANAVLIHCTAEDDILLQRYADRIDAAGRHAIHRDSTRLNDIRAFLKNESTGNLDLPRLRRITDMLDLPVPRMVIDTTTSFPDPMTIADHVRKLLNGEQSATERLP